MDLVPAPAVRLMKRRVLSRPGVNSLMSYFYSLVWRISFPFIFARDFFYFSMGKNIRRGAAEIKNQNNNGRNEKYKPRLPAAKDKRRPPAAKRRK